MTWSQRLGRVFDIDIAIGSVKLIASIEDVGINCQILKHLGEGGAREARSPARAPPSLCD
ncbi:MAG: hypothetical protein PVI25_08330 [Gammaproteobacteria bacterium]|jgi:hypothetical protein